jgi:hypothetical protein
MAGAAGVVFGWVYRCQGVDVSTEDNGGAAFPTGTGVTPYNPGMTLRDYFAAKAMQGFMANKSNPMHFNPSADASWAYDIADAMLRQRQL